MPLDPRIPLGIQPPQIQNPLEAMSTIAQLQGMREQTEARRLAADKARQEAADQAAIRRVLTETGGDVELALPRLRTIAPKAALEFETEIGKARKEKFEGLKSEFDLRGKKLDLSLKVWQNVTDDASLQVARPMVLAISPELAPLLPETYDPAAVERVANMGLSAKELHDRKQEGLKLFTEGKAAEGLGTFFSTARSPEEWDGIATSAVQFGVPKALVAQFGSFSPENVARAGQLAITPTKREELAGQAATRAQTAAHQAAEEATARGHLAVAQGQLGVARAREAREAKGAPGGVKLSPTQQEEIATMLTVEQLAQQVQTIDKQGGLPGVGPWEGRFAPSLRGSGGTTGETLRDKLGNIQGTIAKIRGGTSFTPNEQALLDSYTPTLTDRDDVIRTKLVNLRDFIQNKRENMLRVAAGEYTLPTAAADTTAPPRAAKKNPFVK